MLEAFQSCIKEETKTRFFTNMLFLFLIFSFWGLIMRILFDDSSLRLARIIKNLAMSLYSNASIMPTLGLTANI